MARPDLRLHVLVPGMFGPFPRRGFGRPALPPLPGIERLLRRSRREPFGAAGSANEVLFRLFSVAQPKGGDFPDAALSRLGEGRDADDRCWVHADPVFLRADRDRLLLFDAERIALGTQEARDLCSGLREQGLDLEFASACRWYLRLDRQPDLRTAALYDAAGRSLDSYLPAGSEGAAWRSRLNEVQMLLHQAPVNEQREAREMPPVNSLWFWGVGKLPEGPGRPPFAGVSASHVLARGLARWSGARLTELPAGFPAWKPADRDGDWLVVWDALQRGVLGADLGAWAEALQRLEFTWIAPMLSWLCSNPSARLYLYPASGDRFAVSARQLRRWWQRPQPMLRYLRGEDGESLFA